MLDDLAQQLQQHRWDVGARIRRIRLEKGVSQLDLADRMGIDHRTVSRAENGVHATDIDMIAVIAIGLGVPSWRFFRDE